MLITLRGRMAKAENMTKACNYQKLIIYFVVRGKEPDVHTVIKASSRSPVLSSVNGMPCVVLEIVSAFSAFGMVLARFSGRAGDGALVRLDMFKNAVQIQGKLSCGARRGAVGSVTTVRPVFPIRPPLPGTYQPWLRLSFLGNSGREDLCLTELLRRLIFTPSGVLTSARDV